MQTITLKTRADNDGMVNLAISTHLANRELEIVLVMQPLENELLDEMGYPPGYFEETYGICADDPITRGEQPLLDVRDATE